MSTEAAVKVLLEKVAELEAKLASSSVAAVDSSSTENQSTNTSLRIKPEYFSAVPGDNGITWVRKFKDIAQLNN